MLRMQEHHAEHLVLQHPDLHAQMDQRAIECFAMALNDAAVEDAELRRCLLDHFSRATTRRLAAYPDSANAVPEGLRLPRWSWEGLVDGDGAQCRMAYA